MKKKIPIEYLLKEQEIEPEEPDDIPGDPFTKGF